jgi:hypothetical protein
MRRFAVILIGIALLAVNVLADQPGASELMSKAKAQAAREHKNIFVTFDASW